MRVLQVAAYQAFGGIESYTPDLFEGLESIGQRNIVLYGGGFRPDVERPGRVVWYWPHLEDFLGSGRALAAEALRLIDREHPDVAFIHAGLAGETATGIMERLPTVYFAHSYTAFCPSGTRVLRVSQTSCDLVGVPDGRCLANAFRERCNTRRPGKLIESMRQPAKLAWVRRADAVVCDSTYVAEQHARNGLARDRIHVLPSPVPIPPLSRGRAQRRGHQVLYVGRIHRDKGIDYLIRAIARLPRSRSLVIAGSGPDLQRLEALADREGVRDRVTFAGQVPRAALGDYYRQADVVAVPSVWPEPFGMVGPEAMSYGVPVVAFRSGGIPEWLVDGEVGFLVEPKDVEGLATSIERILGDGGLAQQLGTRGRILAEERFSIKQHVEALVEVFRHVMERRGIILNYAERGVR